VRACGSAGCSLALAFALVLLLCSTGCMSDEKPVKHMNVRFPAELLDELRRSAKQNGRSLHGEILWALREYVARRKRDGEQHS
jgi:hypothetical protein